MLRNCAMPKNIPDSDLTGNITFIQIPSRCICQVFYAFTFFPWGESSIPPSIMHLKVLGHNIEELQPQGERTQHRPEKEPAQQLTRVHFLHSGWMFLAQVHWGHAWTQHIRLQSLKINWFVQPRTKQSCHDRTPVWPNVPSLRYRRDHIKSRHSQVICPTCVSWGCCPKPIQANQQGRSVCSQVNCVYVESSPFDFNYFWYFKWCEGG